MYVTHFRNPEVERPLICSKLTVNGLLKRPDAPCLWRIRRVRPHPFTRTKYSFVVLERLGASEGPRVMHAASVTERVIYDKKVVRHADDLESVQ